MSTEYFTASSVPSTGSQGASAIMRGELAAVEAGFAKLPTLAGHANELVSINAGGTAIESVSAATARARIGLVIGTNVQAWDADLDAISALGSAANKMPYATGPQAWALTDLSPFSRSVLDDLTGDDFLTTLTHTRSETGAIAISAKKEFEYTIRPEQFGAVGDGATDDSGPVNLAADACETIANFGKWKTVLKFTPGRRYRLATAGLKAYNFVRIEGYGSELVGPINAAPRINGGTAVPADNDWAGQTAGAAIADTNVTDALPSVATQSIMIDGVAITGFRIGFVSRRVFAYSRIKDVRIANTDFPIMLYGGVQLSSIENPVFNGCNAGIVACATCMTINHPWQAKDMNYLAGLHVTGEKSGDVQGVAVSDNVDTWFASSILRAGSNAFRAGINFGTFVPLHATGLLVSGWFVYLPARTNNGNQGTVVKGFVTTACDRGMFYSRNDQGTEVGDFGAEFYTSLNPHKATETNSFVVFENPTYAIAEKINTEPASPGSVYDKTVKVYNTLANGFTLLTGFFVHAKSIYGRIDEREFSSVSYYDNTSDASRAHGSNAFRRLTAYPTQNWALVAGNEAIDECFRLAYPVTGDAINSDAVGYRPWIRRIPRNGAANTTTDLTLDTGGVANDHTSGSYLGELIVHSVRLDTGDSDFARYNVRIPYRFGGAAVLLANANITDLSFQVTGASTLYRRGDQVTVNGDKYLVETVAGNIVTTTQPLRANYLLGQAVTKVAAIVTTFTAPAGQFALSVTGTSLRITNSLGAGTPIKFFAWLPGISPYTFVS